MDKKTLIKNTQELFESKFNCKPIVTSTAPGRINLIGEHLDYNNGAAIPCGINRWVCVCISKRDDSEIVIYSDELESEIETNLELNCKSEELWHKYVLGSLKVFKEKYELNKGLNIFIKSTVPIGAGLSSSAALEVSLISAYFQIFNIEIDKIKIAKLSQQIEHKHLLIKSGLLDQLSCLFSKQEHLLYIDFKDNSFEYIKNNINNGTFVIIDSMVKRSLASSKYIDRVNECSQGYQILKTNRIENISQSDLDKLIKYPVIQKRFKHIISEYKRTQLMLKYLMNNNLDSAGKLLLESHLSLKNDYEVSCDEIDFLIDQSLNFPGWYGGRIMGGGFGGCAINLVDKKVADQYIERLKNIYNNQFKIEPDCYNLKIVEGAMIES